MELTKENYYSKEANLEYMSVSQYKDFKRCELYGLKKATGEYVETKSTALLVGGYADSYFAGTLEKYKEENPQIFKKDGTLKSDYEKANECINVAENDEFFIPDIEAEIEIETKYSDLKVWAISAEGYYIGNVPTSYKDGKFTLRVGEVSKSMYYLIVRD